MGLKRRSKRIKRAKQIIANRKAWRERWRNHLRESRPDSTASNGRSNNTAD
jgi:hypothetical protein